MLPIEMTHFKPIVARLPAMIVALALAACASNASPSTTAAAAPPQGAASGATEVASQQVCRREVATGTNIAHTVCREPQSEAERQNGIAAMRDALHSTMMPTGGTGN